MLEHWRQDINKCWNIGPKGCKLASQIGWYGFSSLGANTSPSRCMHQKPTQRAFISNFGQIEKIFSCSVLTPSVKPLALISTFAPIGTLDLCWTLAWTPSVKQASITCYPSRLPKKLIQILEKRKLIVQNIVTPTSLIQLHAWHFVEQQVPFIYMTFLTNMT